jgi:YggT family protein
VQKFTRINSNFVIVPAIVALLIAYVLVNTLCYGIEFLIQGDGVHIAGLLFLTVNDIFQIVIRLLEFLMLTIIVRALLSWFSPDPRNMFVQLIYYITEPVLSPFRRIIPPIGMIDVSALVVILGLGLVIKLVTWGSGAIMGALARSLLGG